jgi:hypothetical protein
VDYLTLLLAGSSTLLLLFLITSVLPDLRARVDSLNDSLTDSLNKQQPASRPRPRTGALPEDRYEDEE